MLSTPFKAEASAVKLICLDQVSLELERLSWNFAYVLFLSARPFLSWKGVKVTATVVGTANGSHSRTAILLLQSLYYYYKYIFIFTMQPLQQHSSPVILRPERSVTAVPSGIIEGACGGKGISVLPIAMFTARGPTAPQDWHKEEYKALRRPMIAKM